SGEKRCRRSADGPGVELERTGPSACCRKPGPQIARDEFKECGAYRSSHGRAQRFCRWRDRAVPGSSVRVSAAAKSGCDTARRSARQLAEHGKVLLDRFGGEIIGDQADVVVGTENDEEWPVAPECFSCRLIK